VQVQLTSDGRMQLVDDQTIYPPLTIAAVTMLSNAIPSAQAVISKTALTNVVQSIATILATVAGVQGTFTVDGVNLTAVLNQEAFDMLAASWGVTPVDGQFVFGPATIITTGA
jgi:hypothetical protein